MRIVHGKISDVFRQLRSGGGRGAVQKTVTNCFLTNFLLYRTQGNKDDSCYASYLQHHK